MALFHSTRRSMFRSGFPVLRFAATLLMAVLASVAIAQKPLPPDLEPLPEPPPPPRLATDPDNIEPQVTIRSEGNNKIEEFRFNGRLYAIRVTPRNGKPYLMVDKDGKGLAPIDNNPGLVRPPQWTVFEF